MNDDKERKPYDMTRYRQRTRKMLIRYLSEAGSASVSEIARDFGQDKRVIRNYLRKYRSDFEVFGMGKGARWSTTKEVRSGGAIVLRDIDLKEVSPLDELDLPD